MLCRLQITQNSLQSIKEVTQTQHRKFNFLWCAVLLTCPSSDYSCLFFMLSQTLPALCTDQAEMDSLMEALIMRYVVQPQSVFPRASQPIPKCTLAKILDSTHQSYPLFFFFQQIPPSEYCGLHRSLLWKTSSLHHFGIAGGRRPQNLPQGIQAKTGKLHANCITIPLRRCSICQHEQEANPAIYYHETIHCTTLLFSFAISGTTVYLTTYSFLESSLHTSGNMIILGRTHKTKTHKRPWKACKMHFMYPFRCATLGSKLQFHDCKLSFCAHWHYDIKWHYTNLWKTRMKKNIGIITTGPFPVICWSFVDKSCVPEFSHC